MRIIQLVLFLSNSYFKCHHKYFHQIRDVVKHLDKHLKYVSMMSLLLLMNYIHIFKNSSVSFMTKTTAVLVSLDSV